MVMRPTSHPLLQVFYHTFAMSTSLLCLILFISFPFFKMKAKNPIKIKESNSFEVHYELKHFKMQSFQVEHDKIRDINLNFAIFVDYMYYVIFTYVLSLVVTFVAIPILFPTRTTKTTTNNRGFKNFVDERSIVNLKEKNARNRA